MSGPSVGLVHDYLLVMRGAERTFAAIADCFDAAPVYTLLYDPEATDRRFAGHPVHPSYLQRLGVRQRGFRRLLPLFPKAAERLPVGEHDVVVSSSSAFAHGVRPRPGSVHVCYCHSPFRYAWHERRRALEEAPRPLRPVANRMLDRVQRWDLRAASRVTSYVANSDVTRQRIADFYGRDSTVIHPPVEVERFEIGEPEDFFVVVTELVPHKRVDLALDAARRAGKAVKVVGEGPDLPRLRALYGESAEVLGRVDDATLRDLLPRAQALILPNIEEFGIAAVEAQAAGRPVVAVAAGGALETVVDGTTGVLVPPDDPGSLAEALRGTDFERFDPQAIRRHAEGFSVERFQAQLLREVDSLSTAS